MSDEKVYKDFLDWLGKTWWQLTDSEYLLPLIKANYAPEEAELLTGMPFSVKTLDELADMKDMDPAELEPRLKEMAKKGMIFESKRGDSVLYRLNDSFFAMMRANLWPGLEDQRTKTTAPLINKYFLDGWFDQYVDVHHKGLRALPIDETIEDSREILPFEDILKVIENRDYYSVSTCPCRHRHNLDPDMPDCKHPTEVCLHFDELGHYVVDNDQGREITKEETFEILKKAADAGLVHGITNFKEKPDTICNCCNCCCMWFEAYYKLDHDRSMDASNYKVEVNPDTCKGCALCIKRCHMDALQLKVHNKAPNKYHKAAVLVDPDLCIGCGVCVHKCPSDSLTLVRNQEITEPPKDVREYGRLFMADRLAAREKSENEAGKEE